MIANIMSYTGYIQTARLSMKGLCKQAHQMSYNPMFIGLFNYQPFYAPKKFDKVEMNWFTNVEDKKPFFIRFLNDKKAKHRTLWNNTCYMTFETLVADKYYRAQLCVNTYNSFSWEFVPAGDLTYLLRVNFSQPDYLIAYMKDFGNGGLTVLEEKEQDRDEESAYVSYGKEKEEAGRWELERFEQKGYLIKLKGFINPKKTNKFVNGYLATTFTTTKSL